MDVKDFPLFYPPHIPKIIGLESFFNEFFKLSKSKSEILSKERY